MIDYHSWLNFSNKGVFINYETWFSNILKHPPPAWSLKIGPFLLPITENLFPLPLIDDLLTPSPWVIIKLPPLPFSRYIIYGEPQSIMTKISQLNFITSKWNFEILTHKDESSWLDIMRKCFPQYSMWENS